MICCKKSTHRRTPLTAVLQFIVITVIAAAFARKAIGKRRPDYGSAGERMIFESAFGLGALGLLIFVLGALQLFYLPWFLALLLVMAAVSWRELSGVISDIASALRSIGHLKLSWESVVIGTILTAIGILTLTRALAPSIADDWDSLAYHLAIPKLFLAHHGIYYVPFASHSNFPFTWEMLYTLGLGFGSVSLAKLFHFGAGLLLVGNICSAARRHFGAAAGGLTALIIGGTPIVAWEATTAYIDLATALYSFLAVYALLNFTATGDRKWAYFAGISVGIAAGTKMTALVMVPVVLAWILWPKSGVKSRQSIATATSAAVIALLLAAPWYIKTLIYTGSPVYPFFFDIFGGRNWSVEAAEFYRLDQLKFGLGRDISSLFALPWNLTFRFARFVDYGARLPRNVLELPAFAGDVLSYLGSVGPVFLAALPTVALGVLRRGRHRPLLAVAAALTLAWFVLMQNARYLIPALAVLAPVIAYSAEIARARRAILVIAAAGGVFSIFLMARFVSPVVPVVIGSESRSDYLACTLDIYRASRFINTEIPKDAKVALFGETRGFYLDRDYIWAEPIHNSLIPFDSFEQDSGIFLNWLSSHGIDYVLVNRRNFAAHDDKSAPGYARLVNRAIDQGMREVYADPTGSIGVYEVESLGGAGATTTNRPHPGGLTSVPSRNTAITVCDTN